MASEQLRREDVDSVKAQAGVVTRIATHFESLHDEINGPYDFPFSPTNQLAGSGSSSGKLSRNNTCNHGHFEEAAKKVPNDTYNHAHFEEVAKMELAPDVSSPMYEKLADAVGKTSQSIMETLANTIAANTVVADEQELKKANDGETRPLSNYTSQKSFNSLSDAQELISSAAECIKDATIDTAKKVEAFLEEKTVVAAEYTEKATVLAKEAAFEAGVNAVIFSEKLAVEARERALVAGLGVAHYTAEVTEGVAGYLEGKTTGSSDVEECIAIKDVSVNVGELRETKLK